MFGIRSRRKTFYLAAGILIASPLAAQQSSVTLKSSDGTIELVGELQQYDGQFYEISTDLGTLRVSAGFVTCSGAGCPETGPLQTVDLTLLGASEISSSLVPLLLDGYAGFIGAEASVNSQQDPNVQDLELVGNDGFGEDIGVFRVVTENSAAGFNALLDKSADIGLSARRIQRDEAQLLSNDGAGNMIDPANEVVVALDSLTVIVNRDNPIGNISLGDLERIYRGEITNWRALGGADQPINVIGRNPSSAAYEVFTSTVLNSNPSTAATEAETDIDVSVAVSSDPSAIGYVGLAVVRQNRALSLLDSCRLNYTPSRFTTKTEEYPLVRRLYMYQRSDEVDPIHNDFMAFVRSQDADSVIAKVGLVDLGMERRSQQDQIVSQRNYMTTINDDFLQEQSADYFERAALWDRLSITMRFATASTVLDAKSERDVQRLISYLRTLDEEVKLAVVGFTDSDGPSSSNLELGQRRALSVLGLLNDRLTDASLETDLEILSFGELGPVACNTTSDGKANNRRVEIWIRNL